MTQLDLSLEANLSARHLSFLETGRSQPSRESLLRLCRILDVPLGERNVMLAAAGLSPSYRRTPFSDPALRQVRRALSFLLERHEPYPAIAVDPGWTVLMANDAYVRFLEWLGDTKLAVAEGRSVHSEPPIAGSNALLPLFDPKGLRSRVVNFDELAPLMLARLYRESVHHPGARELLGRLQDFPGCPSPWDGDIAETQLIAHLVLERETVRISTFSTLTSLGSPQDLTAHEVQLETFFPADEASESFFRRHA